MDKEYIIGTDKYHEATPTCFRSSSIKAEFYTLRDVIFFLENSELSLVESRTKAQALGITPVVSQDQADLMAFLTGEIDSCKQVDKISIDKWNSGKFQNTPFIYIYYSLFFLQPHSYFDYHSTPRSRRRIDLRIKYTRYCSRNQTACPVHRAFNVNIDNGAT